MLRYWDTLIVQSALQEPTVLHAVLALSCVHRSGSNGVRGWSYSALSHYTVAISRLRRHLNEHDTDQARLLVLVACLAFISYDYLQGDFESAVTHLQNGIRVLRESSFVCEFDGRLTLSSIASPAEQDVFRALARQNLLVGLFYLDGGQTPCVSFDLERLEQKHSDKHFVDLPAAWDALELILNDVLCHVSRCRSDGFNLPSGCSGYVVDLQTGIETRLAECYRAFEDSGLDKRVDLRQIVLYHLLHMWYDMTTILASAAMQSDTYIDHFDTFQSIVKHATISRELRLSATPLPTKEGLEFNMSHSLVDVGWIPPLCYAATKCHDVGLRLRAIELIESAAHREGIWDSRMAASRAKEWLQKEGAKEKCKSITPYEAYSTQHEAVLALECLFSVI